MSGLTGADTDDLLFLCGRTVNDNTFALFTIGRDIDFALSLSVTQGGDAGSIS